ncbi:ATP-binding cassette domain-containing protein [Actinomadura sp. KC345]|uniref:ABC transporter ATP-binding protein n=1 Tax=Actinomadura sp. KC345 TaxID=2530371 RepID=UPI001047843F|nr:ATP-binding cassette domain-containing protein [Actinomadura sp. KC345]TDC58549.1 ATP-binding cassette domain-containing protein [Actinomadura sp. KC345]
MAPASERDSASPAVEVAAVSVTFGNLRAVDDVSLTIAPGEIRGLIGPNGAGKSTLVNVIAGEQRAHAGEVRLGGRTFTGRPPRDRAAAGLARTFQHPEIAGRLSVGENLDIARRRAPRERRGTLGWVDELIGELGLESWLPVLAKNAPYPVLKLADTLRALLSAPQVLLVDEPAAGLNRDERERLVGLLTTARERLGTTIVVIEHDVPLVFGLCERISVLDSGRLIADGTAADVRRHPEVIEAYLGVHQ